ncbi:MAG TPA: hypothetical protein VN132_16745, partial [Bdellovibrio sp.]|nr:hypothetical protein [Bdellovibrio sp.]
LLDQVITFANGSLTRENVVEILGLTDRALLFETLTALMERSSQTVIKVIEKIAQSGFEPHLFSQDLLEMIRNLLLVKVSETQAREILEMPDSELAALTELAQQASEEDIHMLFDMALKGGNDIPRAQDPRIVLEVILLRMASAPKLTDLKSLLQGNAASATSNSAGGARPYVPPVAPPVKGHQRLQQSHKVAEVPSGLESMKKALENKTPAMTSASASAKSNASSVAVSEAPTPRLAVGASASEKWVNFVELLRQDDALFAAKIENLLFVKEEGKLLSVAVPHKLVFLKEQLADTQVRKKLQGFIDSYWGAGYSFEVLMNRDQVGESAQALQQKKVQLAEEDIRNQIESNPMVKTAQEVFKGQIKSIVELKQDVKV